MKNYITGIITGISLTASAVMFMGSQNKNLGDITVNSIRVKKDDTYTTMLINNQSLRIVTEVGGISLFKELIVVSNKDNENAVVIGMNDSGGGLLEINNGKGENRFSFSQSNQGDGSMRINNSKGNEVVYLGSNIDNDGLIKLSDRYGDFGWGMIGKK